MQPLSSFFVMVGIGDYLSYTGLCSIVPLLMQQNHFALLFYLLPIYGANYILSAKWLEMLGPFVLYYSIPSMHFHYQCYLITLTGTMNTLF